MRHLKTSLLGAAALAFALALGAQAAEAGNICKKVSNKKTDCVKPRHIKGEAGADFAESSYSALATSDTVVTSVTITAPVDGLVVANASGWFYSSASTAYGYCSLTTGTSLASFYALGVLSASQRYEPWGLTRTFPVSKGSVTINLVCRESLGDVHVYDLSQNAIFVPTQY